MSSLTTDYCPHPEREDAGDGCIGWSGIGGRSLGAREGPLDPPVEIEAELMDATLPTGRGEALRGASGVGPDAGLSPLADLDARGRELDQPPEDIRRRTAATGRMPEALPGLVGFPV